MNRADRKRPTVDGCPLLAAPIAPSERPDKWTGARNRNTAKSRAEGQLAELRTNWRCIVRPGGLLQRARCSPFCLFVRLCCPLTSAQFAAYRRRRRQQIQISSPCVSLALGKSSSFVRVQRRRRRRENCRPTRPASRVAVACLQSGRLMQILAATQTTQLLPQNQITLL